MQKFRAFPFPPINLHVPTKQCKRLQWLDHMETNHFKMLLKVLHILILYLYKLCNTSIILFLKNNLTNICSEINTYNNMKSSGKYGRRGEGECTLHR